MSPVRSLDERKLVTVLFADLASSTELASRHDPEQVRDVRAGLRGAA
jgi:class 3 adenylate cyclase